MKRTAAFVAVVSYALIVLALWLEVCAHPSFSANLGPTLPFAFASGALLLAPLWFFGFGAGEWLRDHLRSVLLRVFLPASLSIPYLIYAFPAGEFRWQIAFIMIALPVILAA